MGYSYFSRVSVFVTLSFLISLVNTQSTNTTQSSLVDEVDTQSNVGFYNLISPTDELCPGPNGPAKSFGGWIGLERKGGTSVEEKRSFFWYFEAENNAKDAPIIVNMGGGPGSSGMLNALIYATPCMFGPNGGLHPNPNRWTEKWNLLVLDHPIGVGYSYGQRVNNSHDAAEDVWVFMQRFFKLYPNLAKNTVVMEDGSYGGVYLAHNGAVINAHNKALKPGEVKVRLDSVMLHNPFFDPLAHYEWLLHYRCTLHQVHNATTCQEVTGYLGPCLEAIHLAFEVPSVERSVTAQNICLGQLGGGSTNGILLEDIRKRCDSDDVFECYPEYGWANDIFNGEAGRRIFRTPEGVKFETGGPVGGEFWDAGDLVQPHQRLYTTLLKEGIRTLFYVGAQDANCGWPGILSALKRLDSPYRQEFLTAEDKPWRPESNTNTTIRTAGNGHLTFMLLQDAGHTVGQDQPVLVKELIDSWIQARQTQKE